VGNSQQTSKLYRQALEQTTGYRRTATTLTLTNARKQVVASFVKPIATLPGTQWQVGSYYNGASAIVSSINSERMTATFGEDGQVSGSGGCNHYFASYKFSAKAGTISISPPASTRMACAGADVMKEENLFFKALSSAKTFKRADNILELSNEHGIRVVTFRLKGK
jgi:heat shock protein HslJ